MNSSSPEAGAEPQVAAAQPDSAGQAAAETQEEAEPVDAPDEEPLADDEYDEAVEQEPSIDDIVQMCLRNGTLFEDPKFPAGDESLFINPFNYPSYVWEGVGVSSWRRPEQISRNAQLFVEGSPPGDVACGDIDDAWFLGAASLVAMRPDLLANNFANAEYARDAGVVMCRLYKEGAWREVMVDTRLPYCDTPDIRRVANGHCLNKDEVWIPILEKAMAKIAGCYEKLRASGTLANALVDLTGGSVATYDLRTPQMAELVQSNELWNFVRSWFVSGCVLGCVLEQEDAEDPPDGVLPNRAHGVLDVVEVESLRLVRIRNPWGQTEWKGAFADHDQMWNKYPDLKDKLGYEFGPDGTWWMRFDDWVTAFNQLYVCRLFPQHWQQHQITGVWHEMTAAGAPVARTDKSDPDPRWFNNPQTRITLETDKPTTVFFSLVQSEENPRQSTNLMLLKVKGAARLWDCVRSDVVGVALENQQDPQREITFEIQLNPAETGKQYIAVCYQDVPKPEANVACKFYLRVFASEPIKVESVLSPQTLFFSGEWKAHSSAGGRRLKNGKNDNPQWAKNPQLFLLPRRTTNVKIVCERHLFRRRQQGVTVGFLTTRMASSAEPKSPTRKRRGDLGKTGSTAHDDESAPLVDLKRRIQVLPTDWCQETSYAAEDYACMFVTISPQQGPIVVVPSLSEEGVAGQFTLSVFSDKRLGGAVMLDDSCNSFMVGQWSSDTAGGCHLYSPPFEQAKAATWSRNPRYNLVAQQRMRIHVTLGRIERTWRPQLAKDAVGCMLGLYICQNDITRENVLAETTFVPGHEVSLEATLDACSPDNPYLIVPCTYEPGKVGEFMLRITSDEAVFEVTDAAPPKPKDS
jgi:hypothetical protein